MLLYHLYWIIIYISCAYRAKNQDQTAFFHLSLGRAKKELNFLSENKAEIVDYHKVKRLSLTEMGSDDADQFLICEFNGYDFEILAK
jgi:hypothetical protein